MIVTLVTATRNRHRHLERLVRFVLNQTYDGKIYHLIYNNACDPLRLNTNLDPNKFILVNNCRSYTTKLPYKTLGEIYQDILQHIPEDTDIINFMDDDDVFLPNHVEEGVRGYIKGGVKAYKPQKSWYKYLKTTQLAENTLEPSIFVDKNHILKYGFSDETTAQHIHWLKPLVEEQQIFVDPQGLPTYICDWSQEIPTFKTSGDPNNPNNFRNYNEWSKDHGDGIITPCSNSWAEHYYRTS